MKTWIIGTAALIVLVMAAYVGFGNSNTRTDTAQEAADHETITDATDAQSSTAHAEEDHTNLPEGMTMEEHMRLMDDGKTVMAMVGQLNPKVIYATPGQELVFASHENFDIQLKTKDGNFMTVLAKPGSEHTTFTAPPKPGRYDYYSSHDPKIFVTIVVEE